MDLDPPDRTEHQPGVADLRMRPGPRRLHEHALPAQRHDDPPPPRLTAPTLQAHGGAIAHGTHDFLDEPRYEQVLIWVNGELLPRDRAVVSVFDSGFVLGDGVWEGLRVSSGQPAFLDLHFDRLYEG